MTSERLPPNSLWPALCLETRVELADIVQEDYCGQPSQGSPRKTASHRFFCANPEYRQLQQALEHGRHVHRMMDKVMRRTVGSNRLSPSRQTHLSTQTSTTRLPQLQVRLNNPWHNPVLNCFLGTHPEARLHAAGFDDAQAEVVIATVADAKKNIQCGIRVTRIPVVFRMGGLRPAGGLQGLGSVPTPVNGRTRSPRWKPLNPSSSPCRPTISEEDGSDPPFSLRIGTAGAARLTLARRLFGGRSRPKSPCGKAG